VVSSAKKWGDDADMLKEAIETHKERVQITLKDLEKLPKDAPERKSGLIWLEFSKSYLDLNGEPNLGPPNSMLLKAQDQIKKYRKRISKQHLEVARVENSEYFTFRLELIKLLVAEVKSERKKRIIKQGGSAPQLASRDIAARVLVKLRSRSPAEREKAGLDDEHHWDGGGKLNSEGAVRRFIIRYKLI
jgi:hypothetical protein